jgi:hypothetical protein
MRHSLNPLPVGRRAAALLLPLIVLLGLAANPAAADTKTVTVPATLVFQHGANPDPAHPGNCSALVFAQWASTGQNVTSGTATVKFQSPAGYTTASSAAGPLFQDTTQYVRTYTVSPGAHWINVGTSGGDGVEPDDCHALDARHHELFAGAVATIALTVEVDEAVCAKAKAKSMARSKSVTKAKTKLKNASKSKKPGAKKALESARAKLATARGQVNASC